MGVQKTNSDDTTRANLNGIDLTRQRLSNGISNPSMGHTSRESRLNDKGARIPRHHDTKDKGNLNKLLNLQEK